ncbi:MAG: hypothetical protein JNK86_06890 [Alphaproteobacteria bacterium]|nr:hypothetical protein [Alphaproteobacteria bacterium]
MNIKAIILGTLFVSGFVVSGCSETPEEKVRREVKEKCEAFVRSAAPPTEREENLQRIINECTEHDTRIGLERLNQSQSN